MEHNIVEVLKKTKLFENLTDEQLNTLGSKAKVEKFSEGTLIIKEGSVGNFLFIILEGAVRVFTNNKEGNEVVLARLDEDDYFGVQALTSATPSTRNANVKALTEVRAIMISHQDFQEVLKANDNLRSLLDSQGRTHLISKLLNQLYEHRENERELFSLFNFIEQFPKNSVLYEQDEPTDSVYYLLYGSVELSYIDGNKKTVQSGQLLSSMEEYKNPTRIAKAVALDNCSLALIDLATFTYVLKKNSSLRDLVEGKVRLYDISPVGLLFQYHTEFSGNPAIGSTIQKRNEEIIRALSVAEVGLFTMHYEGMQEAKKIFYQESRAHFREILVNNSVIVGIINVGEWGDLGSIVELIYKKQVLTPEMLKCFNENGKICDDRQSDWMTRAKICPCLQISTELIKKMMVGGDASIEILASKTGIGSVCSSCLGPLKELIGGEQWTLVKIDSIRAHDDHTRSYRLVPINKRLALPEPGQHISIQAYIDGQWVSRNYTLTSTKHDSEHYEITIRNEKGGFFSPWLFAHDKENILLRVSSPKGSFKFTDESPQILFFAAGLGLTPAIAFGRSLIGKGGQQKLHVDYSIHDKEDAIFKDELSKWGDEHPFFSLNLRCTSEAGRLSEEELLKIVDKYPGAPIFICGPKDFEDQVVSFLRKKIPEDRIYIERFTPATSQE